MGVCFLNFESTPKEEQEVNDCSTSTSTSTRLVASGCSMIVNKKVTSLKRGIFPLSFCSLIDQNTQNLCRCQRATGGQTRIFFFSVSLKAELAGFPSFHVNKHSNLSQPFTITLIFFLKIDSRKF